MGLPIPNVFKEKLNSILKRGSNGGFIMKVLVTGGAGYIGSVTDVELLEEGHDVVILDQLANSEFNGSSENVNKVADLAQVERDSPRLRAHDGNVGNIATLTDLLALEKELDGKPIEAVIDFAAYAEAGTSQQNPESYLENNAINSYHFVKTMFQGGVQRIIKSSTAAAFGFMDSGKGFTERDVFRFADDPYYESNLDPAQTQEGIKIAKTMHEALAARKPTSFVMKGIDNVLANWGGRKKEDELHAYCMNYTAKRLCGDNEFRGFWEYVLTPMSQARLKNTVNVYGWTKVMNEITLEYFAQKYDKDFVILRYFNAWGVLPGLREDHDPETHLIPIAMDRIKAYESRADKDSNVLKKGEFMYINGTEYNTPDNTCVRDYIHVVDLANAHIAALTSPTGAYNLGTNQGDSVKEVLEKAARGAGVGLVVLKKEDLGKTYNLTEVDGETQLEILNGHMPEKALYAVESDPRAGDPDRLVANPRKANKILNWQAQFTIDNMDKIREVYQSR